MLHAMRQIMRKDKTHYRQISSMTHGGVTREMRCVYGKKAKHVLVLAFIFFQIQAMHHFYFVLLHNCNCILARAPKSITDKLHRWLLQRMPGTWKLTCSRAWTSASEDFILRYTNVRIIIIIIIWAKQQEATASSSECSCLRPCLLMSLL